ncbi:hypothetical protein ACIRRH_26220 [Kitasatospora sp. NPDC101235]|uniref:hypothetical protein n=1 Tax=Kitasatospora sp. NPDC101235 TaxID=3364101 RepID=UPI0038296C20
MRTARAVLLGAGVLAGVGLAHLLLNRRYHQRRIILAVEDMDQRLTGDAPPEWYTDHPLSAGLDHETRAGVIHVDRALSLTAAKHRAGQMPDGELDFLLCVLALEPAAQTYWERIGRRRVDQAAAGDKTSQRFGEGLVRAFGEPVAEPHST